MNFFVAGNPMTTAISWQPSSPFALPGTIRRRTTALPNYFAAGNPMTTRIDWTPASLPFVITIRLTATVLQDGTRDGQTQHAELVQAAEMLWRIGHDALTSNQLSGTVTDRNGVVSGSWTYTPTASQ